MPVKVLGKGTAKAKLRRHLRLRKKISGSTERPRLVVTRTLRHITAQVVDDSKGATLASASTVAKADKTAKSGNKTEQAKAIGLLVAQKAQKAGVKEVVFDRGGNKYHGRVAALADGAREGGLKL
ncbi:MAG: 50S ribosomal protein L18 [Candidatus Ancillula sp.]|jgi:large subunit ribosomal protein L18|nr:50S ribosomal protein L18 [Candidatus Ancillula sp.]